MLEGHSWVEYLIANVISMSCFNNNIEMIIVTNKKKSRLSWCLLCCINNRVPLEYCINRVYVGVLSVLSDVWRTNVLLAGQAERNKTQETIKLSLSSCVHSCRGVAGGWFYYRRSFGFCALVHRINIPNRGIRVVDRLCRSGGRLCL